MGNLLDSVQFSLGTVRINGQPNLIADQANHAPSSCLSGHDHATAAALYVFDATRLAESYRHVNDAKLVEPKPTQKPTQDFRRTHHFDRLSFSIFQMHFLEIGLHLVVSHAPPLMSTRKNRIPVNGAQN